MKRNLSRLLFGFALTLLLACCLPPRGWAHVGGAGTRFRDYRDFGCEARPLASDAQCVPCAEGVAGMPRWWVSQCYQSVWVADEPLSYLLSNGERMAFRWTHRQRYSVPQVSTYFYYGFGPTINVWGRDGEPSSGYRDMRTFGATNAAWGQSWLSDITLWDYGWESAWRTYYDPPLPPTFALFSTNYEAFAYRADGGIIYFNSPSSTSDGDTRLGIEPLSALGYPTMGATTNADGLYWGGAQTNGVRLRYADGGLEIYGLAFHVFGDPLATKKTTAKALLTQRVDPQGRVTRIGYEKVSVTNGTIQVVFRPRLVVDPDGRTNTIRYVTGERWQVSEIEDPYGRKAKAEYGSGYGPAKLIDAQNLTNTFAYQTGSGWLSSYTTPYSTTSFEYYDEFESGDPEYYQKRAVRVAGPEGVKQLFAFVYNTVAVTPATVTNVPSVTGWAFDNGATGSHEPELYHRNSFHWSPRQYGALSGLVNTSGSLASLLTTISNNASAYRLPHLQHWLLGASGTGWDTTTDFLSSEREPSPDAAGTAEGARTWYAYGNTAEPELEPAEPLVGCAARLLPDGTTQFQATDSYNANGQPLAQRASYTKPDGSVGVRSNWLAYATNAVDLLSASNTLGQFVKYSWNTNSQVTGLTNALNEVTSVSYVDLLTEKKPLVITFPGGQTATFTYYTGSFSNSVFVWLPEARFLKRLQWTPGPTWNFGYAKGLMKTATNDLGLWLTFTWDDLLRPTSTSFPDGTYTSNRYDKLDLIATRDRLGHWTYAGYDALQHPIAITNANNAVTRLDWCGCGVLNSITDALTNITSYFYNNQGLLTNTVFADGSNRKYFYDLAGRTTNVMYGLNRSLKLAYNNQGLLTTVSNDYGLLERVVYNAIDLPQQSTDENGVTVTNTFDLLNRLTARVWPDGFGETYGWSTNGLIAHTNRNQQVTRFTRDAAGRLTAVTNANNEVTRVVLNTLGHVTDLFDGLNHHTAWTYDIYGLRRTKTDALNRTAFSWDYNPNGWLTNRTTPQFGNTTYSYDPVGNLTNIVYPASSIAYAFNALNQLTNMAEGFGVTKFTYTATGRLASEDGPWSDDTVTLSYTEGLRTAMSVGSAWSQSYSYDSAWRMTSLSSPAGSFGYTYHATRITQLIGITLPNFATITNDFDSLGRLRETALQNRWGHTLDGSTYGNDLLGLRSNLTRNLGFTMSTVDAGYDSISQLISWSAKETNNTPRLNEQLGWNFDAVGNLLRRTNNALIVTFGNNAVNQLTNATRSGALTVNGNTPAPATNVTVNGQGAARYGDFTFASSNGFTLNNGANSFTNIAQNVYGLKVTNIVNVNLPLTVTFTNDLNGNLISDGVRWHEYDAENQLTAVTLSNAWRTEFVYDGLCRRRIIRDYTWNLGLGTWNLTNTTRQVFDGLLPIQERDGNNNPLVTYTRGLDFSGSLQGAGGIGGLLARTDTAGSVFYHADGSGNVTAMMNGDGEIVARYLYNPFGKLTGKWGTLADANVMRFSSMPYYEKEDLVGYYARFLKLSLPMWLAEDPLGEAGGIPLRGFVFNDPVNLVDDWGMQARPAQPRPSRNSIPGVVSDPAINREMRARGLTRRQLELEREMREAKMDQNTRANSGQYYPAPLNLNGRPQLSPLIPKPKPKPPTPATKPCPPLNVSRNAVPDSVTSPNKWGAQHGGDAHWQRMQQIADAMQRNNWRDIRVNRQQVDAAGNNMGRNRPDVAGNNPLTGLRHNIEIDTTASSSASHQNTVNANDPNSQNTFIRLP